MPKGKYDRHVVIPVDISNSPHRKVSCYCGYCKVCRDRIKSRNRRSKILIPVNEIAVDNEPLFDDLTFKLIKYFEERGFD